MKLLNSSRIEIVFQLETRELGKMARNHFTTQENYEFAIFSQFIVSLSVLTITTGGKSTSKLMKL